MTRPLLEPAALPVWIGLAYVIGFILVSSLIAAFHPRLRDKPGVRAAIYSWWPVMIVAALGTLFGPLATVVVLGLVSAGLVREGLGVLGLSPDAHRLHVRLGVATAVLVHALLLVDGALATTLALAAALALAPVLHLLVCGPDNFIRAAGGATWVLLAGVGLFSFVARTIVGVAGGPFEGPGAGFVFFLLVMMADAIQYVGGKLFGRRPLVPRVSPRKTWEGLLFGVFVCTCLGGHVAPFYLGLPRGAGAALGAAICLLGLCGDLIVSGWKRDAGVKDTGAVLPGQGGLLDRCDSLLFVAPWYFLLVASRIGPVP